MAAIRPAISDRSPVMTRCTPALAPSPRILVMMSVSRPPDSSPSQGVNPPHGALLAEAGEPALGQQVLTPADLVPEPGDQADRPLGLGPGHHRPAVGQGGQRE